MNLLFIFFLVLAAGAGDTVAQDNSAELSRAHQLLDRGKPDEGIASLKEISRREPNRKGMAHELGIAIYKKSDFAQAISYLQKALLENPEDNEAVQLLGLSYYLAGAASRRDRAARKGPDLVPQRECGCRLPPGRLLHCGRGMRRRELNQTGLTRGFSTQPVMSCSDTNTIYKVTDREGPFRPFQAFQMAFVEDNDAVEQLPPATAHPALGDAILPGCPPEKPQGRLILERPSSVVAGRAVSTNILHFFARVVVFTCPDRLTAAAPPVSSGRC